jgi:hypothetical protein
MKHRKKPETDIKTEKTCPKHRKAPETDTKTEKTCLKHRKTPETDTKTEKTCQYRDNEDRKMGHVHEKAASCGQAHRKPDNFHENGDFGGQTKEN